MKKYPEYSWLEDEGIAFCDIEYKGLTFCGMAHCHPDDKDMQSRLTGKTIAEFRATVKYLKFIRDFEITPQLKSLNQLYYSMNHSKYFDPKSYEAKMLYRQIKNLKEDLEAIKEEIQCQKDSLKTYLETKETDHAKIRAHKAKKELVEDNQESCN